MSGFLRFLVSSTVSLGVCAFVFASDAATGRGDYTNVRQDVGSTGAGKSASGAAGRNGTAPTVNRMPSMPTLPVFVIGNVSTNVPKTGTNVPSVPNTPDNPGGSDDSNQETPGDEQGQICQDAYTVENCMNSLAACIDGGALPNGLKDLFNNDLRTSIINGMNLCAVQVDKCITDTTLNCNKVYSSRADVWIDFNSRRVQPEYYSFVLGKTGLTPTQAENTCLLLDSNTYGSSFNRVKNAAKALEKENDTLVYPYNNKENSTKANPLGEKENTDYKRGHYARWDAVEGECLIRVAAYNKDKLITNDSLFGAIGDGSPAESWQVAGSAFTCNKDLFDFGLMRDTRTAAAIALPGGAVLGAGTGAVVGNVRAKNNDNKCKNKDYRDELWKKIPKENLGTINAFLKGNGYKGDLQPYQTTLIEDKCKEVLDLYFKMQTARDHADACRVYLEAPAVGEGEAIVVNARSIKTGGGNTTVESGNTTVETSSEYEYNDAFESECASLTRLKKETGFECGEKTCDNCIDFFWFDAQVGQLEKAFGDFSPGEGKNPSAAKGALVGGAIGLGAGGIATGIVALIEANNIHCVVGDGLGSVQYKKSYAIDSLKDLYVKHKLNLPDTKLTGASTMIKDQTQWKKQCATYDKEDSCNDAQFYYQYSTTGKSGAYSTEWIYSACEWDEEEGTCGAKTVLFNSYGVPGGIYVGPYLNDKPSVSVPEK